jgi:hypothetical protein
MTDYTKLGRDQANLLLDFFGAAQKAIPSHKVGELRVKQKFMHPTDQHWLVLVKPSGFSSNNVFGVDDEGHLFSFTPDTMVFAAP